MGDLKDNKEIKEHFYAQLDNDNICVGVQETTSALSGENIVEIESYDVSLLGKKYDGGKWTDTPAPPTPPRPLSESEQLLLSTAVNVEYLIAIQEMVL